MYTRSKLYTNLGANSNPDRYIERIDDINDIANSQLLYYLDQEELRFDYTITKYDNRIDLISNDIYGTDKYSWILLYINRVSIDQLVRGKVINYIPIDRLETILSSI